jgi:hypothetical protein
MTQVALEISESQATPKRVNFIYCGTRTSTIREAIDRFGYPASNKLGVQKLEHMLQTDRAKFIAIRVGPEGLTPRLKLYGHAQFDFSDLSVCEGVRKGASRGPRLLPA